MRKYKVGIIGCGNISGNYLRYAYEPDEIVPVSEISKFTVATSVRQGITYSEAYSSRAAVTGIVTSSELSEFIVIVRGIAVILST